MIDYENVALAVKVGIVDEEFIFQWMRSQLLRDYNTFAPIVLYRRLESKVPTVYIEFEGLKNAWSEGISYKDGRKLKETKKKSIFS